MSIERIESGSNENKDQTSYDQRHEEIENLMQENMLDTTTDFAVLLGLDKLQPSSEDDDPYCLLKSSKSKKEKKQKKTIIYDIEETKTNLDSTVKNLPLKNQNILNDSLYEKLNLPIRYKYIIEKYDRSYLLGDNFDSLELYKILRDVDESKINIETCAKQSDKKDLMSALEDIMLEITNSYNKELKDLHKKIFIISLPENHPSIKKNEVPEIEQSVIKYCNQYAPLMISLTKRKYNDSTDKIFIRFIWIEDEIKEELKQKYLDSINIEEDNIDDLDDDLNEDLDDKYSDIVDRNERISKTSNGIIENNENEEDLIPQKHLYDSEYEDDDPTCERFDQDEEIWYGHRLDISKLDLDDRLKQWLLDFDKYCYLVSESWSSFDIFRLVRSTQKLSVSLRWEYFYAYIHDSLDILEDICKQLKQHCGNLIEDHNTKVIIFNVKKGIKNEKKILEEAESRFREICNPKSNVKIILTEDRGSENKGDAELMLIWVDKLNK